MLDDDDIKDVNEQSEEQGETFEEGNSSAC